MSLSVEDQGFTLRPVGDVSAFDPQEAWEVHFAVVDSAPYKGFAQKGFFRDMSVHERAARRAVREHFFKLEKESGEKLEPTIETPQGKGRYQGQVFMQTDKYVALVRNGEMVSLHRKSKLDKELRVGQQATIAYKGKQGAVL